ncbi:MAG: Ivy family c-type lysozyme inhibitor [Usitatibacteraceae bacterium]
MGAWKSRLLALMLGYVIAVLSTTVFAEDYLYDVLAKPAYGKSWNALFRGEKKVDPWLAKYFKTKDGPATPGSAVKLGGTQCQVYFVCKTHDCDRNRFLVMFAPNGSAAWGVLLKDGEGGKQERFFGAPDQAKRDALRAVAAKG